MKLIACMPVRNEDWVLGVSLRVALMWCDEVVVLLHACTDRSADIITEVARETMIDGHARIPVLMAKRGEWHEMEDRQAMLEYARERGATHIAIIDADEILTGNLIFQGTRPQGTPLSGWDYAIGTVPSRILQLPLYNLRNGIEQYHSNGIWGNRIVSLAFADDPRLHWAGDTFHQREPQGMKLEPYRPIQQGQGGVMHLWGANERRLIAKHALYKITERLRFPAKPISVIDDLYSLAIKPREPWTFANFPESWWAPYRDLMAKHLHLDAEPWQIAEVRRLLSDYGRERFRGLDLFGVDSE